MFGNIRLRCLGPHIWNTLPGNITEQISFAKFKESIVGTEQVVNVVFIATKNEIKLLIWNSQQSIPA